MTIKELKSELDHLADDMVVEIELQQGNYTIERTGIRITPDGDGKAIIKAI